MVGCSGGVGTTNGVLVASVDREPRDGLDSVGTLNAEELNDVEGTGLAPNRLGRELVGFDDTPIPGFVNFGDDGSD